MKIYTHEEIKNRFIGPIGTPERDLYEQQLAEELEAYRLGETIKQMRKAQNLTQAELGKKMGIDQSQVSKIENGKNLSFTSLKRIFKALGIEANLDLKEYGSFAL